MLVSVLQDSDLNLVIPALKLDFIDLFVRQFRDKFRARFSTPLRNLRIQHRPPLLSTFHIHSRASTGNWVLATGYCF